MAYIDELATRMLQKRNQRMGDRVRVTINGVTREAIFRDSPVPESPEEELARLREENARLRATGAELLERWDDTALAIHEEHVLSRESDAAFRAAHDAKKAAYAAALGLSPE